MALVAVSCGVRRRLQVQVGQVQLILTVPDPSTGASTLQQFSRPCRSPGPPLQSPPPIRTHPSPLDLTRIAFITPLPLVRALERKGPSRLCISLSQSHVYIVHVRPLPHYGESLTRKIPRANSSLETRKGSISGTSFGTKQKHNSAHALPAIQHTPLPHQQPATSARRWLSFSVCICISTHIPPWAISFADPNLISPWSWCLHITRSPLPPSPSPSTFPSSPSKALLFRAGHEKHYLQSSSLRQRS